MPWVHHVITCNKLGASCQSVRGIQTLVLFSRNLKLRGRWGGDEGVRPIGSGRTQETHCKLDLSQESIYPWSPGPPSIRRTTMTLRSLGTKVNSDLVSNSP